MTADRPLGPFLAALGWSKELSQRVAPSLKAIGFCGLYGSLIVLFRLLLLTITTYFMLYSHASHQPRFEEINEAYGATELSLIGFCALFLVLMLRWVNPIASVVTSDIFTVARFKKFFMPGFFHGAIFAFGIVIIFAVTGLFRPLGFLIQFEEFWLTLWWIAIRCCALFVLVYCEEFLFRNKMLLGFLGRKAAEEGADHEQPFKTDMMSVVLVSFLYCGIKLLQFNLGIMQLITLFLLSVALSLRTLMDRDFVGGSGFWFAILLIFHPMLSLSVFGSDFSGVYLLKHIPLDSENLGVTLTRLLTGGAGGPLSGFAFQLLLILDIIRRSTRYKKQLG